jgi:hypothetical protein
MPARTAPPGRGVPRCAGPDSTVAPAADILRTTREARGGTARALRRDEDAMKAR